MLCEVQNGEVEEALTTAILETAIEQLGWNQVCEQGCCKGFTRPQWEILENPNRFTLISGGERGGKSEFLARWMYLKVQETLVRQVASKQKITRPAIFWLVAADYERTRVEFVYLQDFLLRTYGKGLVKFTTVINPGQIEIKVGDQAWAIIKTKSTSDETTLVMEALEAIGVCEGSQISYNAYLRLQGRVAETRGDLCLAGTMEQSLGWYPSMLKRWLSPTVWATEDSRAWILPSHSNHFIYPLGEKDPELLRLKASMSEADFSMRHLGVPSPPKGLVHPMFSMAVHVREVKYEKDETIYLAIDPGIAGPEGGGSSYAIVACQYINGQLRVFDEIHESGKLEAFIIEHILMKKPWWNKSDIIAVIDRAGSARAGAHEASVEVYRKLTGLNLLYTEKAIPIADQIRRFDSFLRVNDITGEPGLVIDVSCDGLLSELGGVLNRRVNPPELRAYQWNISSTGDVVGTVPRDRNNDAIKALTYLMCHQWGYATVQSSRKSIPVIRRRRAYA